MSEGKPGRTYTDSSYGSSRTYEYLKAKGIESVVKSKSNSRADRGYRARREAVKLFLELGRRAWAKLNTASGGWSKRPSQRLMFGEYCLSKTQINIVKELMAKAYIYNMVVNT